MDVVYMTCINPQNPLVQVKSMDGNSVPFPASCGKFPY